MTVNPSFALVFAHSVSLRPASSPSPLPLYILFPVFPTAIRQHGRAAPGAGTSTGSGVSFIKLSNMLPMNHFALLFASVVLCNESVPMYLGSVDIENECASQESILQSILNGSSSGSRIGIKHGKYVVSEEIYHEDRPDSAVHSLR